MEGFCRGCLVQYNDPAELLQYTEKNRRLFVYCTGLQVKRNDTFVFQLCKDCYINMKQSCKFKKQCRTSDKKFKYYLLSKEGDDTIDLGTFLKNHDDNMVLRFPLMSGNNTPANNRRDDDNASTCTSIGNFMMDLLQGEEMPDTEARIIKQVIEEEADVLEDSLDSHWLQDDISIDPDFGIDFSFSPFATPHSVNRDHCYTPKRPSDQQVHKYICSSVTKRNVNIDQDDDANNVNTNVNFKNNETLYTKQINRNQDLKTHLEDNFYTENELQSNHMKNSMKTIYSDNILQSDQTKNNVNINFHPNYDDDDNFDDFDEVENNVPMIDALLVPPENVNYDTEIDHVGSNIIVENTVGHGKNYYIPNDVTDYESNIEINHDLLDKDINEIKVTNMKCTIDRNLEEALKDCDKKEISLEDLLASPTVFPGTYAPSTPTIDNIMREAKPELDDHNSNVHKVGQFIEKFQNVDNYIKVLDDFFTDIPNQYDFQDYSKGINNKEDCKKKTEDNQRGNDIENQYNIEDCYCKICKKKFKTMKVLRIHFTKSHKFKIPREKVKRRPKLCICDYCGKKFVNYPNFVKHVRNHMRPPIDFRCERCSISFTSKAFLRAHQTSHMGSYLSKPKMEKKFYCHICGATLSTSGNFAVHLRRHNKDYVASCEQCGKGFVTKTEFAIHMRKHTGELPFKCTECKRAFRRRTGLILHVKTHIGERPFECDHCHARFIKKDSMIRHTRNSKCALKVRGLYVEDKSKKYAYECFYCHKKFVKQKNFINHQNTKSKCLTRRQGMENRKGEETIKEDPEL
ncbi:zinc finger protein 677 [Galleria mellonella]|uniref:Zinc finger protein 677 n=1 Tax=Galleria mellonella TaxID=7137 RepID=A0ABM3MFT9_GALME|nr:zinc finger protein 677 [Galleria mellonella]XP_052750279.1 zinc finger protein 677 [Galleria mellonella]XP_052750280.1 zinc finger protein 677 [Galleria mellonella]XP_052750281.1 zinc finger protein 677 [Galleria mellonella]